MLDFQAVGNNIRSLRIKDGYSQDKLSELLGVSHQAVSRWELGLTAPSIDNLVELCDLFGVGFDELLCINRKIEWDAKDIFKGHSRMFVIKQITENEIEYDVVKNFHLFMPQERILILKAVKNGKITVNKSALYNKLTPEETRYLKGKR